MPKTFDWIKYIPIPPATPESLWELEDLGKVVEEFEYADEIPISQVILSRFSRPPLYNLQKNINGGFKEQQYG